MSYTRRDFNKLALAGVPAALALGSLPLSARAKINSRIKGVQIGAITYSFRTMPNPEDIIKAYVDIGLGEMELMSGDAEKLAGAPVLSFGRGGGRAAGAPPAGAAAPPAAATAPPAAAPTGATPPAGEEAGGRRGGGRAQLTPEQQAVREAALKKLQDWRKSATEATFKPVKKKIEDAGIELALLCYNMNVKTTTDDEIEYAFVMAKGLGVKAISTSTQVSMASRVAPFAEKHKMMVGFHGHANLTNPDEVAKPESFDAVMAAGKYLGANLDIGHYTEAGYDPVAYIQAHHARITNLHLKDKKKGTNGGGNTPWGQGDTDIKAVLKLLQKNKWDIPSNIEFEYPGDPLVEIPKCVQFCKEALA
jgi:sugar phosphate isomerase/epimerase